MPKIPMAAPKLPYESQTYPWMCGAAALAMVYRSLGRNDTQTEIWKRVGWQNPQRQWRARSHLLARDALAQGLSALVVQVRDPWLVLERCRDLSLRVILNHHWQQESEAGHYSVLVNLDEDNVWLHDPNLGPNRCLTRPEWLRLWNANPLGSEIIGQVLVAISPDPVPLSPCPLCSRVPAATLECTCGRVVALEPGGMLGCLAAGCPMRAWTQIFCPGCDHGWRHWPAAPVLP